MHSKIVELHYHKCWFLYIQGRVRTSWIHGSTHLSHHPVSSPWQFVPDFQRTTMTVVSLRLALVMLHHRLQWYRSFWKCDIILCHIGSTCAVCAPAHSVRSRVRLSAPRMPCILYDLVYVCQHRECRAICIRVSQFQLKLNIYITEYLHSCINIPIELLTLIIFSFKIRVSVHLFINQLLLFTGNLAHQLNASAF